MASLALINMGLVGDTVVVINRSGSPPDYMPLYTALLVAAVAVIGTVVQRRIADKAVVVQREIAERTVGTQLEIARRENVVQSRREWARELRSLVGAFQSVSLSLSAKGRVAGTTESVDEKVVGLAELRRLYGMIVLLLDLKKPEHKEIESTLNAVLEYAIWPEEVAAARTELGDKIKHKSARRFPSHGDAFETLENQIAALLEANWQKIKDGS